MPGNDHVAVKPRPDHVETALNFRRSSPVSSRVTFKQTQSARGLWTKTLVQITVMLPLVKKRLLGDLKHSGSSGAGARSLEPVRGPILSVPCSEAQL